MNIEKYRLKRLARFARGRERIVDVGWCDCPNPYFDNRQVIGLDLREERLPDNYHLSRLGNVMNLPQPFEPETFDAIIAGEIVEHLENPLEFLRRCRETLKEEGIIILSTPNPNSPIERVLTLTLNRRFFYAAGHKALIPQRWLIRLMEIAGFCQVRLYSGGFPFPLFGTIPFPRPWCYQTIAVGVKGMTLPEGASTNRLR